jgi:hypothetical protein
MRERLNIDYATMRALVTSRAGPTHINAGDMATAEQIQSGTSRSCATVGSRKSRRFSRRARMASHTGLMNC